MWIFQAVGTKCLDLIVLNPQNLKNEKNDKDYIFEKLSNLLFSDVNPIPLKALAEKYHKKGYELRLPLTKLCESKKQKLYEEFDKLLKLLKETD